MHNQFLTKLIKNTQKWATDNIAGLFVFNLVIILLVLLRFAGYFTPFLTININVIYMFSLILSVIFLHVSSKMMFIIALAFWFLAAFLKSVEVDIWADRTVEYFFQALLFGVMLSFGPLLNKRQKSD